jgi:hypothetical protein
VEADVPEIYYEIAETEGEFAVADVPSQRYRDRAKYMFYQTVHQKPIPAGIVNRAEAGLENTTGEVVTILSDKSNINSETLEILRRYGAGFVIAHSFHDGKDHVAVYRLLER